MKRKLLSMFLVLTTLVSLISCFGTVSLAADDATQCKVKFDEQNGGTYHMVIGGADTGEYTFTRTQRGYTITTSYGKYLAYEEGDIVKTDDKFVWSKDRGGFYTSVKETVLSSYSRRSRKVEVKYYLGADANGKLIAAKKSGNVYFAVEAGVQSVDVDVKSSRGYFFRIGWFFNYVSGNSQVTIKPNAVGTTVKKVEYSLDGTTYTEGKKFTIDGDVGIIYICITDSFGKITNWKYENGKTAQTEDGYITFSSDDEFTLGVALNWRKNKCLAVDKLQYSTNAQDWNDWDGSDVTAVKSYGRYYVYLRGDGLTGLYLDYNYTQLSLSSENDNARVRCTGNIMTLLDWDNPDDVEMSDSAFELLFSDCILLEKAPELPATTLAEECYYRMFDGCTSLTVAPELPAITLADWCYEDMFNDCTSLTAAPELPATVLTDGCYSGMFGGCTSLPVAPELPATTLAYECYEYMFCGCTSITKAPELSVMTLEEECYAAMFKNCTSLVVAPELPAKKLADSCYYEMFFGCTALTEAPELNATILAEGCYEEMFYNCTVLTEAPKLPASKLAEYCYDSMFYGCTALTEAPELNATILAEGCYMNMFHNCTTLTAAPVLPATDLANYCYDGMFYGCTSLTVAPELLATTLTEGCYEGMFHGCTSLKEAPELAATDLADWCYGYMFMDCTSLEKAPELPATTLASSCYYQMFSGCSNLVTAPSISATAFDSWACAYQMFDGCSSLDISTDESGTAFVTISSANASYAIYNMFANTKNSITAAAGNTYYYKVSSAE